MSAPRYKSTETCGFSLTETLMVVATIAIFSGIAVPLMMSGVDSLRLGTVARNVERELQTARLKAVQANQPIRVRFNCPATGQYRRVEYVGSAGVDTATDRCSPTAYPFPAPDRNAMTRPNNDGTVQRLDSDVSVSGFDMVDGSTASAYSNPSVEFWPDGTAHAAGTLATNPWPAIVGDPGIRITLSRNSKTKTITVNGLGKIQMQ